jgi:site-specific recombinase XerD
MENHATADSVADIQRIHIIDFLASLSEPKLTGVRRARKLAAFREFFKHLIAAVLLEGSLPPA